MYRGRTDGRLFTHYSGLSSHHHDWSWWAQLHFELFSTNFGQILEDFLRKQEAWRKSWHSWALTTGFLWILSVQHRTVDVTRAVWHCTVREGNGVCVCVCVCVFDLRKKGATLITRYQPQGWCHPPQCLRRHNPSRLWISASPWGDVSWWVSIG